MAKRRRRRLKKKIWVIILVLLIGLGAFVYYKNSDVKSVSSPVSVIKKITKTENIKKIPVLFIKEDTSIDTVLKVVKDKNYHTISYANYKKWQKETDYYNDKLVLIVVESDLQIESCKKENEECVRDIKIDLDFVENDAFSEIGKYYWYTIFPSTSPERFNDILDEKTMPDDQYAERIGVLNYHFFHTVDGECNESICLKRSKFEEQMKYLKENEYKSLTMLEYYKWMNNEIQLPEKSVLLTVDDGAMGTENILPEMLTRYKQHGTLFLITSFWPMDRYTVGYLEIQSHSDALHDRNYCSGGKCGIKTLVLTKDEIKKDLQKSKEIIGNPIAYCYPFYQYDDKTVEAVKEEFKLAFVGGNRKSTREDDIYLIPRYVILNDITLDDFENMIS